MSDYRGAAGTVVEKIQRDHQVILGLLDRFDTAARSERGAVLRDAVEYLVRHETAEEEVVFPALRAAVPAAERFVVACAREQARLFVHLVVMEEMDSTSLDFWDEIGLLREEISRHSTHEEEVVLPMLQGADGLDLLALGHDYEALRVTAPARP